MIRISLLLLSLLSLSAHTAPLPAVVVSEVSTADLRPVFDVVGRVEAMARVELEARVSGNLEQQHFQEGTRVDKGQLLFSIEQASYQIQVKQAEATLAGAKAALKNSQAELLRKQQLKKKGVASRAELDQAEAARDQALAQVSQAEAGLENARLNLSYTKIHSPINGRIGKVELTPGNLVKSNSGILATVVQTDPVYVELSVSEKIMIESRRRGAKPDNPDVSASLILADGSRYPHPGHFNFISPEVDRHTDTLVIRATFANPDNLLLPGAFVRVEIAKTEQQPVIAVPQSSVQKNKQGYFVLTVDRNDVVLLKQVQMGRQYQGLWEVTAGLNTGEQLIIEGLQKVRPGITVRTVEQ